MVLELPEQNNQILPPDTKIIDIFEQTNRALLILGDPGSASAAAIPPFSNNGSRTSSPPHQGKRRPRASLEGPLLPRWKGAPWGPLHPPHQEKRRPRASLEGPLHPPYQGGLGGILLGGRQGRSAIPPRLHSWLFSSSWQAASLLIENAPLCFSALWRDAQKDVRIYPPSTLWSILF
jgi:hypothetical protein